VSAHRLGFACNWDRDEQGTWSGTPWHLRAALRLTTDVLDLPVGVPPLFESGLRLASARPTIGGWRSPWRHTAAHQVLVRRSLGRHAGEVDVVLEIGDLAPIDTPFFVYQDLSIDAVIDNFDVEAGSTPHFPAMGPAFLRRRRARQLRTYDAAAGVLVMSAWLQRSLIERSGVDARKVHVIPPGVAADIVATSSDHRLHRARRRLLFMGRDFATKGGFEVLRAFELLRRRLGADIELTIAGPAAWPGGGSGPPDGVRFLGPVRRSEVPGLYDSHDVFVMPSIFEGFGIVFAEALSRGLPCVVRNACAMPEIVEHRRNGWVVDDLSPDVLAAGIVSVLGDDAVYRSTAADAGRVRAYYDWARVAADVAAATGIVESSRS
jgi:glycosyltransferase involved in cell wall biosynthesis